MTYDVCVVGLGGMGSAILAHCATRGARAIGIEQFARGHELGASSGKSRMIRKAYFEDSGYVPLVLRAYELWHELEDEAGEQLLQPTGVLTVGHETDEIITGTLRAAREHSLSIEKLSATELISRYPALRIRPAEVALFEPDAGVLKPERAITAYLNLAERRGAVTRFNTRMRSFEEGIGGFNILLDDNSSINAHALVLSLGPWCTGLLGEIGVTIRVQRNVQAWFEPFTRSYSASNFPAFLLSRPELPAPLYGFPDLGDGVKAAFHGHGDFVDPDKLDRAIDDERDIAPIICAMEDWMPGGAGELVATKVCMYSLTSDHHFLVDRLPGHERLVICGGFSGHGFKFAPVIGEIAADLALSGGTQHPIEFLSLRRFRRA